MRGWHLLRLGRRLHDVPGGLVVCGGRRHADSLHGGHILAGGLDELRGLHPLHGRPILERGRSLHQLPRGSVLCLGRLRVLLQRQRRLLWNDDRFQQLLPDGLPGWPIFTGRFELGERLHELRSRHLFGRLGRSLRRLLARHVPERRRSELLSE